MPALQTVVRIVDILGKQTPAAMANCLYLKHWLMHTAFAAPWIASCTQTVFQPFQLSVRQDWRCGSPLAECGSRA